jgi:hypothetical protein
MKKTTHNNSIYARILCAVLVFLHLSVYSVAQAQVPTVPALGLYKKASATDYVSALIAGNNNVTRNNLGATVLNLPAGETSEATFALFKGQTIIWARYYGLAGKGTIQIVSATQTGLNSAGGTVQLSIINYDPITANKLYTDYSSRSGINAKFSGVAPFAPFDTANGLWSNINQAEFFTAVGQAALRYSAPISYVAVSQQRDDIRTWDNCIIRVFGGCLKRRYYQELNTYIKPKWSIGTSQDNARGRLYTTALRVANCTTTEPGGCIMQSGIGFLDTTAGSDYPQTETLDSTIMHSQDGWTGLAYALLFAAVASIGSSLLLSEFGLFAAGANAFADAAITSTTLGFSLDAAAYSLVTSAANSGGSINNAQNGLFGRLDSIPAAGSYTPATIVPEWDMMPKVTKNFLEKDITKSGSSEGVMFQNHLPTANAEGTNDFWQQRQAQPVRDGSPATN